MVVTVRATWPRVSQMLREPRRLAAQLVVQALGVADVLRERLLVRDRDPFRRDLEPARVEAARAIAQLPSDDAAQERPKLVVVERGEPADRVDARRRRASPRRAARRPGSRRIGNGARNAASRPGRTTVSPPGLRRSEATLATTFDVATPSEHESRVRARTTARTVSATARASSNDGRDLLEIEVALVDPGLLDRRHDLAHRRPHLARVVAVERVAGADERRLRAAAQRLRARHRRVDAEAAGDVVRGRDDAAAAWVAADDERHRLQRRVFELFHRGEERIEVEVRDDHVPRVGTRAVAAVLGLPRARGWLAGCGSSHAPTASVAAPPPTAAVVKHCVAGSARALGTSRRAYVGSAPHGAVALRRPGGSGASHGSAPRNVNHYPTVFGVVGMVVGRDCKPRWYRVELPIKPNGSRGYVRASSLRLQAVSARVDRRPLGSPPDAVREREGDAHGRRSRSARRRRRRRPAGTTSTSGSSRPTRPGRTGPAPSGISAFSNVLTGWTQGGPVAIHGTNEPWSIGHAVSNGCIRLPNATLLKVFAAAVAGTPVIIKA